MVSLGLKFPFPNGNREERRTCEVMLPLCPGPRGPRGCDIPSCHLGDKVWGSALILDLADVRQSVRNGLKIWEANGEGQVPQLYTSPAKGQEEGIWDMSLKIK